MSKFLWAFLGFLGVATGALAQGNVAQPVTPGYLSVSGCPSTTPCFIPWNATTPMPVSGTFSATLSGFRPTTTGTPIAVTTGGVTGTLPAGTQVVATNVGTTNGAYCKLGASATTSDQYIAPNGGWFGFAISGDTQLTCITGTSTTTVNMTGGSGLPTGTGGGGGGSGGSVTQGTTPWIVAGQGTAGAAAAAVTTVQGIASMTPVQVSQATAASLNATVVGTGTFATQAAQSGTWNITNVSGTVSLPTGASTAANQTSVIGTIGAGTAATNALATGGIYNSSPITMTTGQGAAHQLDVNGYLAVNVKTSVLPTNAARAYNDEQAFTPGVGTFTGIGGFFQTTATSNALTTGQEGLVQMTATRSLFTNLRDSTGAETGVAAVPLQVSLANTGANGTAVAVGQSGTWNITNVSGTVSLPTGASTAANQTSVIGTVAAGTAATNALATGGIYNSSPITMTNGQGAAHQLDVNGYLNVNVKAATGLAQASTTSGQTGSLVMGAVTTAAPSYTTAQTNPLSLTTAGALRADLNSIAGTTIVTGGVAGSQSVGGTVATNVAITANPINLGAQAVSSENTAVTTARQVQLVADLVGKLIVLPYANPENFVSGAITTAMTATTSTSLIAAPGAGLRNYITSCQFSNTHATVGTEMTLQDGSGGTALLTIPAAAVYGGAVIQFPTPLRQPTANTALFTVNITTGASTKASCQGYKGA